MDRPSPYRILALDGGGIRGYLSALLLARLERERPGLLGRFDLLAGTSTGSIIALSLAAGFSPAEIAELYAHNVRRIFETTLARRLREANGLLGPRYGVQRLAAALRTVFSDRRLGDLPRKVLVPAFDLDDENPDPARRRWKSRLFHNFPGDGGDAACLLRKVALYSSVVPAVFASVDGYVDGGLFAANPALCAVALALEKCGDANGSHIPDLRLLSLGTGLGPLHLGEETEQWGLAQWARPLLGLVLDAGVGMVDYQCRQLLRGNYHRLNPWIEGPAILLDDLSALDRLHEAAETADLAPALAWLDATILGAAR
ncbi:MAG TPA: patatin-like phospholipase family protein [Gammaproteobacteria bacterium]|nr:patatin-like phospholipase family protein [Gammaproteobacteria bacterium]